MKSTLQNSMQATNIDMDKQSGFSLVEIMIAMLISLFLLGGVIQVYSSTRTTYRTNEGISRLQENARFVFDRIAADLNAAGFLGCNDSNDREDTGTHKVYNQLTLGAANPAYNFVDPVAGADATGPGYIGANSTDRLFVRRSIGGSAVKLAQPYLHDETHPSAFTLQLDTTSQNINSFEQYQIMALSDCERTAIFMITNDPDPAVGQIQFLPGVIAPGTAINPGQSNIGITYNGVTLTDLKGTFGVRGASTATAYNIATTQYDVQPSPTSASGFSLFLNGNSEFVEDIVDMQILFGINNDGVPGAEQFVQANSAVLAAAGMNAIASMQVSLTLEAPNVQVNGQPVRKTFTRTFRLRNR